MYHLCWYSRHGWLISLVRIWKAGVSELGENPQQFFLDLPSPGSPSHHTPEHLSLIDSQFPPIHIMIASPLRLGINTALRSSLASSTQFTARRAGYRYYSAVKSKVNALARVLVGIMLTRLCLIRPSRKLSRRRSPGKLRRSRSSGSKTLLILV